MLVFFVGGNNLTGALHVLQLQLSPPPSSSLAPLQSRMETFWYQLTQVYLEKWPLKRRERENNEIFIAPYGQQVGSVKAPVNNKYNKLCGRPPQYAPAPCKLTFNLLTLKVVSKSRVTCATYVPILVFLCLSVLDLGPMYATDRQTDVRCALSLNASYPRGGA